MRSVLAMWLLALAAPLGAGVVQMTLDTTAINEAIAIGQSRVERDRARFHAPYRLSVKKPPVDTVEVITPFRQVVLTAESRVQIGDRNFGQRQAMELLRTVGSDLTVSVEFTFHPLNTYVGVPDYVITLAGRGTNVFLARTVERFPRFGARVDGMPPPLPIPVAGIVPGGSQPVLGGTMVAHFDGRALDLAGIYDVVIVESGKELARVLADLRALR